MANIIRSGECGNSPKNAFVEEIAIETFLGTEGWLRERLASDALLMLSGGTRIEGADAIEDHLAQHVRRAFDTLTIDHAISHGRVGAANGVITFDGREIAFCIVVEFASVKADRVQAIKLHGL